MSRRSSLRSALDGAVVKTSTHKKPPRKATVDRSARREHQDSSTIVDALTDELERICETNEKECAGPDLADATRIFYGTFRQPFAMRYYVGRLVSHFRCSPAAYVAAMIYLQRVQRVHPSLRVTYFSVHRLLTAAVVLAAKYLDDRVYGNGYYARVGGVETEELNGLELQFLKAVSFDLSLDGEEFRGVERRLLDEALALSDVSE